MNEEVILRDMREINNLLSYLLEKELDFIVIGNAAISMLLNEKTVTRDIDLVVFSPDPVLEEDFYYELANELNCEYEKNNLGGPRLVFSDGFWIDFLSPSMNLEVPLNIFDYHEKIRLGDKKVVKIASFELALILKAQAVAWETSSEEELMEYISKIGKKINKSRLEKILELYDEGLMKTITRILKKVRFI